jgi:hypothetical protein
MSLTGFTVNSVDLKYIFALKTSGTTQSTGFISGGVDLSNIFQPYDSISAKTIATGYTVGGNDLNNIFQNLKIYIRTNYNPFSANLTPTGYIYDIFSVSQTITLPSNIINAYILLIGGGGGGGSGLGYEGGGAGGSVTTTGPINLSLGATYTITIGSGGNGGPFTSGNFNGANGSPGGTTSVTGPSLSLIALGGGGGGGSKQGSTGAGGTNTNSNNYGKGGQHGVTVNNVQGNVNGNGYNGYPYTFQDGTGTIFKFGGGGGAGGRNSTSNDTTNTGGGGGVFGNYGNPTISFTAETGGCGGTGSFGINTFQGNDFTFNNIYYNTGSGGGGGGNSSALNYSYGGKGSDGLAIIYFQ